MPNVRRPILIVINLLLALLGVGCLTIYSILRLSSNLVLQYHPPKDEVIAQVYQITDVRKLQAMAANQYEYLDNFASMIESFRDLTLLAAVLVLAFSTVNFALIPWRMLGREDVA